MSDWSLFEIDGAVWNESGESDDHIVPDPKDAWEGTCIVKGEPKKKFCRETFNALSKSAEQRSVGNKNVCLTDKGVSLSSVIKEEPSAQLLDMDPLCDLHCEKQSATYNLMHPNAKMGSESVDKKTYQDIKQESTENDLITGICKEDPTHENGDSIVEDRDDSLVNNFCHFSLSDICPPEGDLEFFGNEHEDEDSCSLLDYGWENIGNFEDVDGLLRSCESTFGHSVNTGVDELPWPSSTSACFDNSIQGNVQQGHPSSSPESRALKGKSQQNEQKMEFMPCDYPPTPATCQIDGSKGVDFQKKNSMSITDKPMRHESSRNIQESQQNVVNGIKCSYGEQKKVGHSWKSEGTLTNQNKNADTCHDIGKNGDSGKDKHSIDFLAANTIEKPYLVSMQKGTSFSRSVCQLLHGILELENDLDRRCVWGCQDSVLHGDYFSDASYSLVKVNSYRKQSVGHKQSEKKHKKHLSDKKTTQKMPPVITYSSGFQVQHSIFPKWQTSASSAVQIFPSPMHASQKNMVETASLRQVYPQFPYIHAQYGYPLHHVPAMPYLSNLRPREEQSKPLFVGSQIPADVSNQPHLISKPAVIPSRPPSMTPQEKIEKLRWRQQMQARLAVEHQQQQLDSQKTSTNHSSVHKQPENIHCQKAEAIPMEGITKVLQSPQTESDWVTPQGNSRIVSELTYSDDDGSLEAIVLHQLQNVISRLGMKKRLCIRDSLYRLARSAMQRRFIGDAKSSSENGDRTQSDRCVGPNDMETETNPFDRTIAHLLFHKSSMPSSGPMTAAADSSNTTFSTNLQSFSSTPNFWLSQTPEFELLTEMQIVPATNLHFPISGQMPTPIAKNGVGCCSQNMIDRNGSSPGCSYIASDVLFDPQICGSLASMDVENSEDILVLKHQGLSQNNDSICPSVKCNHTAEKGAIIDNNDGLIELRCQNQNLPEVKEEINTFPSSTQTLMKKESIESPEIEMLDRESDAVDVMDTNSELVASEQFSEIRGLKKHRLTR